MAASRWGHFSFGDPLSSLLKSYQLVVKHCCQWVGPVFLWWPSTKLVEIILLCCETWLPVGGASFPLVTLYQASWNHITLLLNMAASGWDQFPFGDPLPSLLKSYYFVVKHDCQWLGPVFLWWPSTKLVEIILLCCETWLPVGEASFPLVTLYQASWNHITLLWNMAASGWGQFYFGDPLPSLLKSYYFVVKHGCQWVGPVFPLVTLYQACWYHITLLWNMTASGWGQFSFGVPLPS